MRQLRADEYYNGIYRGRLDDGWRLICSRTGAVLVFGNAFLHHHQVTLEAGGRTIFTAFGEREIQGKRYITALFSRVRPGLYTFSCRFSGHSTTVPVKAGWITRVDWRDKVERTETAASRDVPSHLRRWAAAAVDGDAGGADAVGEDPLSATLP